MSEPDQILDDEAAAANRIDARRATIISLVAVITVLLASMLMVLDGPIL